jgi:hypothetical protein
MKKVLKSEPIDTQKTKKKPTTKVNTTADVTKKEKSSEKISSLPKNNKKRRMQLQIAKEKAVELEPQAEEEVAEVAPSSSLSLTAMSESKSKRVRRESVRGRRGGQTAAVGASAPTTRSYHHLTRAALASLR